MEQFLPLIYMLVLLLASQGLNIFLGVIQSGITSFDWKKLLRGIGKALAVSIGIFWLCAILTYLPSVFALAGIEVSEEVVTVSQLFVILGTSIIGYLKQCIEKMQVISNKSA